MNEKIIREEIEKCARCGKCRAVCPVFYETREEGQVARGRVVLVKAILDGDLPSNKTVEKHLASCLKCLRCAKNCPSGVNFDRIIMAGLEKFGPPWWMKFFFRTVLVSRKLFDITLKIASFWQKLLPRKRKGYLRHLPLLFSGKRNIPNIASKSALKMFPEISPANPEKKRVALFLGCMLNYVYPEVIGSLVRFLNKRGVTVIIPRNQLCCGAPVISTGDHEGALKLAKKNTAAFKNLNIEAILTACATGGRMLKFEYQDLLEKKDVFEAPVMDFTEYITANFELKKSKNPGKITYHDPCHLKWGQGISEEPRKILKQTNDFIESPDADRCCGFGGVFSMYHYDLGSKIFDRKEGLKNTEAEKIVTACPGCMLQISDQLENSGDQRPVIHLAQLLDQENEL